MSILDEIARGSRTSPLDIAKAGTQGRMDYMNMRVQALKTEEWIAQRDRDNRLRASLVGTDFTDPKSTAEAAKTAAGIEGGYEVALKLSKHALAQKPKKGESFTDMMPIFSGSTQIGYGQKDKGGRLYNFQTMSKIDKKSDKPDKPTKVGRPNKEQIETATKWVEESEAFGQEGAWNVGFSSDDNKKLGRTIASRAQKLIVDAKVLKQSISDEEAMDIAAQEIEALGSTIYEEGAFGSKDLKGDIKFEPGISTTLQNFLGVNPTPIDIDIPKVSNESEYDKLPKGTKYIDPNGVERIKG